MAVCVLPKIAVKFYAANTVLSCAKITSCRRKKTKTAGSVSASRREQRLAPPAGDGLWQALKDKRLQLAREQAVPPYVIFHDSSLIEMHASKPQTLAEFALISGVGESKLQRYAQAFMQVISDYAVAEEFL